MKTIKIFSSCGDIVIKDDNDESIEKYAQDLSELLKSSNVSILHTSSGSIITRPNTISVIAVSGTEETVDNKVEEQKEETIPDEPEDIISLEE